MAAKENLRDFVKKTLRVRGDLCPATYEYYHQTDLIGSLEDSLTFYVNGPEGNPILEDTAIIYVVGNSDPETVASALYDQMRNQFPDMEPKEGTDSVIVNVLLHRLRNEVRILDRRNECGGEIQDLFSQRIEYLRPHLGMTGASPQYNGNINSIEFCIFGRSGKETFAFAYDELDRLKQTEVNTDQRLTNADLRSN